MDKQDNKIHLIGYAHLDPVWLWPWTEGFSEVKATFRSALDRIKEYPEFIFTFPGACYYSWVEENAPEMFEEVRRRVQEGRIALVNGWWIQPDCNIPCGESYARHALYSQRYYKEKFGITCNVGYNADSFGHNGMLPQILKKSGMDYYVFMRPGDHENPDIPILFNWESSDGSKVAAFKIIISYNSGYADDLKNKLERVKSITQELNKDTMMFYGVGNHGGGPTISMLNYFKEIMKQPDGGSLVFGSPNSYMETVNKENLPIWKHDLQNHAIGCYSAVLSVKQQNRRAETSLLTAECVGSMAHMLLGAPYGKKRIEEAWKRTMFNQFHDILCGCSIKEAYRDAAESYGFATCIASEEKNMALQRISWAIDTLGEDKLPCSKEEDWSFWGLEEKGTPLVVHNPLPFDATLPISAARDLGRITDKVGNEMDIQVVRGPVTNGENDKWNTLFMARLPAFGYSTFWLHKKANEKHVPSPGLSQNGMSTDNKFFTLHFDEEKGCLAKIVDKATGGNILKESGIMGLIIDETHSDTWGHNLDEYRDVIGSFKKVSMDWIEKGPLRNTMRIKSSYGESTMIQDIIIYRDLPYIDIRLVVYWMEKHKMLKLEFPVNANDGVMTAEIPYGHIRREMDGHENPMQRWVDVSGGASGLTVINNSSYGADIKNSDIRVTVLRSPVFADHYGKRDDLCEYTDQGEHEVRFRLISHSGNWAKADAVKAAYELNTPPSLIYESYHKGSLPLSGKGLEINTDNVFASALKEAEDGCGYVLRCFEAHGAAVNAKISLPYINRSWEAHFAPNEIKTFFIPYDANEGIVEVDFIERAI